MPTASQSSKNELARPNPQELTSKWCMWHAQPMGSHRVNSTYLPLFLFRQYSKFPSMRPVISIFIMILQISEIINMSWFKLVIMISWGTVYHLPLSLNSGRSIWYRRYRATKSTPEPVALDFILSRFPEFTNRTSLLILSLHFRPLPRRVWRHKELTRTRITPLCLHVYRTNLPKILCSRTQLQPLGIWSNATLYCSQCAHWWVFLTFQRRRLSGDWKVFPLKLITNFNRREDYP